MTSITYTRERVAELLAAAAENDLVELADECLSDGAQFAVLAAPEIGSIAAQVREPIMHHRFFLGDVLACRAEVSLDGTRGWAMRMGDNRVATLAAAVCDAEVTAERPRADRIRQLCARIERDRELADRDEWAALAPTVVQFEELT
ncbi:phosphonate metabolism protein PhnG [Rhodococcus triatomae]|uniref:Alpha-D-ribose 1-methylphosphonate 5-triphosphate synthase subunit PhnG n=1 Tax=Rhodococcus triatomae TaxID=300028 RepID=A0A1G8QQD7_9NOCA|nr:phosphonate C-P lyase system protein PhnG [Rhodococcus triatomae]QNG20615.1 phosphonate metabolism protein PhnG [Rhodococcus triatomae]QNG23467.1 phosphonate metabolism protein PhnG [Rhodococcus triatomae]SDJ06330.1 alpha-D-ribose 1-methylphosphonate 5-triphosphate synthase subunit PhnG [Rhodococcus triatomae]